MGTIELLQLVNIRMMSVKTIRMSVTCGEGHKSLPLDKLVVDVEKVVRVKIIWLLPVSLITVH